MNFLRPRSLTVPVTPPLPPERARRAREARRGELSARKSLPRENYIVAIVRFSQCLTIICSRPLIIAQRNPEAPPSPCTNCEIKLVHQAALFRLGQINSFHRTRPRVGGGQRSRCALMSISSANKSYVRDEPTASITAWESLCLAFTANQEESALSILPSPLQSRIAFSSCFRVIVTLARSRGISLYNHRYLVTLVSPQKMTRPINNS